MAGKKTKTHCAALVPSGVLPAQSQAGQSGREQRAAAGRISPTLQLSRGLGLRRDFWF